MSKHDRFDTTIRIPVVTDLVAPGDADVIRRARERNPRALGSSYEHTLKIRMADIQSATGQDEYGKLGRAHAIRSESNKRPASSDLAAEPAAKKAIHE
ncbi:hypothetical protein [Thiofilum flexile]|uniref:hypothetical protein n=1 Tax=Thiofilum flexile TaxID=125627 RepID=UPI00036033E4|nr:hypothetical protein [Thiofilum flexile]